MPARASNLSVQILSFLVGMMLTVPISMMVVVMIPIRVLLRMLVVMIPPMIVVMMAIAILSAFSFFRVMKAIVGYTCETGAADKCQRSEGNCSS
jgi:hypothetical protein